MSVGPSRPSPSVAPASAAAAERQAERLRHDLAATLEQIADNLAPARLASEAVAAARDRTPDWLVRYWRFAQSPAGLAVIGGTALLGVSGTLVAKRAAGRQTRGRRRR